MFRLWHRLKSNDINRKTFQSAMIPIRNNIECLLIGGSHCGHPKTENTCQRILKQKQALWTFVEVEGVEPTNHLAEQLIHFHVLWRKNSFGTQSERGNLFVERMMTTTATCQLQGRIIATTTSLRPSQPISRASQLLHSCPTNKNLKLMI